MFRGIKDSSYFLSKNVSVSRGTIVKNRFVLTRQLQTQATVLDEDVKLENPFEFLGEIAVSRGTILEKTL